MDYCSSLPLLGVMASVTLNIRYWQGSVSPLIWQQGKRECSKLPAYFILKTILCFSVQNYFFFSQLFTFKAVFTTIWGFQSFIIIVIFICFTGKTVDAGKKRHLVKALDVLVLFLRDK